MRIHMISHIKLHSSTSYHIFLAHFGQHLMDLDVLKLPTGFQKKPSHPTFLLVGQSSWFGLTICCIGIGHMTQVMTM